MYIFIYIYIYIYIHINTYINILIYAYIHIYIKQKYMFRVSLPDVSSTRRWPHASPVIIWPAFDQTLQATKWATSLSSQVN